jgi:O-antigen ligase
MLFFTDVRLGPAAGAQPNEEARLAWVPIYLVVLALSLPRLSRILAAMRANLSLVLLLLLPLSSALWSIEPGDTLRRGGALLLGALLGFFLAVRFTPAGLLRVLLWGLAPAVLLSWIFVLAWPDRGIMSYPYAGSWRGIFTQKNALGQVMLLNVLVVLMVLPATRRYRWLLWVDLALSLVLLIQANSKTYLLGGLVLAATGVSAKLWIGRSRQFAPAIALLATATILVSINIDTILALFGRDLTLTGRTDLWQAVWPMIEQRMLLGYGYQAFWISPLGPAAQVWFDIDWRAPNAHNGILEWWLGLGIVGLALLAFVVLGAALRAIRASRGVDRTRTLWTLMFLSLFLLSGISESDVLSQNDLLSVLFITSVVYCNAAGRKAVRGRDAVRGGTARAAAAGPTSIS